MLVVVACATPPTEPETGIVTGPPVAIPHGPYEPGRSYFGRNDYVEYIAGNAPVILTAPHGGALAPASIPDRLAAACGGAATTGTDLNTVELAKAMQAGYFARFGAYPHVVVMHLARRKVDANRVGQESHCGNADAGIANQQWHDFIDAAKRTVLLSHGRGWYMDMHGHRHEIQRLELGYLLTGGQLELDDAVLDATLALEDTASIQTMSRTSSLSFSAMLRGESSLGTLYVENGFRALPSSSEPKAAGNPYFSGGDNTRRHSCGAEATPFGGASGGMICGVQIEANFTGVRDTPANRERFAEVTALVLEQFLRTHWGVELGAR